MMNYDDALTIDVLSSTELVAIDIRDARPQVIEMFGGLSEEQRVAFATDAWKIGARAFSSALAQAREAQLQDIGAGLLADLDAQLRAHVDAQQRTMADVMAKFFDPNDGQVTQRLTDFVRDEGVLARLLEKHLAPKNSVLAETLARHVGEASPLFKMLSPTDSAGLVKVLEGQLRQVLHEQQHALTRALDPKADGSPIARLIGELREELATADADRAKQLHTALAALNANDEGSLISRMWRETERARSSLLNAVNPSVQGSPMAVITQTLTTLLKDQGELQAKLLKAQQASFTAFEKEMREAVARLETKRAHDQKSTRGGFVFEDAVVAFLGELLESAPCVLDVTAKKPGKAGASKNGDAVARFTAESAYAGAAVVFEAKHEKNYTVQKALDELGEARRNRDAQVGVFILAASHAPDAFPHFARHGNNVLVVWDERDRSTDARLQAAVMLGIALVARVRTVGEEGDIAAMRDVEKRIEQELERLVRMEKHSDTIRAQADKISEEIRKANKALGRLMEKATSTLRALNVELKDETEERKSPIALTNSSLGNATAAMEAGEAAE